MRRSLLAVLLVAGVASPAVAQVIQQPPSIVTRGDADVKRAPDRAWLSISTETRDPKAGDARTRSAAAMVAVQDALKRAGVTADGIRTTGYSLAPEMEYTAGRSTMKGYLVRNSIEVRVDDLDRLPAVLEAANAEKSTTLMISGPRFDLKNMEAARNEALRQAVEIAMARAAAIAAGARRTVGAILRIDDESSPQPPVGPVPLMRAAGMAATAAAPETPINPGEIDIRASVTLTVEIR